MTTDPQASSSSDRDESSASTASGPTVFDSPSSLMGREGTQLGVTEWLTIDQARIDTFAEATGDHQWIHVDPAKAADGPYGATIAHGYLTLALTNLFLPQLIEVQNLAMGINYGVDKVRFPSPVVVGSRVRGSAVLSEVAQVGEAIQTVVTATVEIEGGTKPACVVEAVSRWFGTT